MHLVAAMFAAGAQSARRLIGQRHQRPARHVVLIVNGAYPMFLTNSTRKALSGVCFALSSVWAVAGICKFVFGLRITIFFLPPLGLERVAVWPSLGVAAGFLLIGAWLGRDRDSAAMPPRTESVGGPETSAALPPASPEWTREARQVATPAPVPPRRSK